MLLSCTVIVVVLYTVIVVVVLYSTVLLLLQADYKKDYLVYAFSLDRRQWGFQPVFGLEEYLYICEVPIEVRICHLLS